MRFSHLGFGQRQIFHTFHVYVRWLRYWGKHAESNIRFKQRSRDDIVSALENNHYSLYTLNWQSGSPATTVSVWRNQINYKTSSIQNEWLHFETGLTSEQRFEREVESSNRKRNNSTPKGQFQNKTNKIYIYIYCFHIRERKKRQTNLVGRAEFHQPNMNIFRPR